MNTCHSLPGITLLSYLADDYLPSDICYKAVAGIPVAITQQPISIPTVDVAVCEVEEQTDNNVQMEKVKLSFSTLRELPTRQNIGFVIRTVDGKLYIIGSKERPYPTVKVTTTTGQPDGDASVRKYEVSYTARKALAALNS